MLPAIAARGPRGLAVALLALVVALVHLMLVGGWAAAERDARLSDRAPARIEVTFVRELQPEVPAAAPPQRVTPAPARRVAVARAPARPASRPALGPDDGPAPAAAEDTPSDPQVVAVPESIADPLDPLPADALASTSLPDAGPAPADDRPPADALAAALPAASAASAPAPAAAGPDGGFEWPRSTRLSYRLTGNYRGPVDGQAQVEWLRDGSHYQVHLEVQIGPSFAPLIVRRMSSDGEIHAGGLQPRRYDESTRVVLREPRQLTVHFDAETIRLANGRVAPRPPGVQDSASQFVQLTWLFTTRPALLQPGGSLELPLALPRNVDVWTYDIADSERLYTPVGALDAVHVKPRRAPRPGGDLTAETWFAPALHHLPVRIIVRQDADTWIDLLLERLPLQAAEPADPSPAGQPSDAARAPSAGTGGR